MKRRKRRRARRLFCLLLVLLTGIYLFLRVRFDPVVRDLAETQVRNRTSDLINDAISRQIREGDIAYERLVYFEKDLQGRITALKTNMAQVNRLKTEVLNQINTGILDLDTHDVGLPLGSLFLPEFFSGKGPVLPVRVVSISNSDASFSGRFSEAGINQTLHQLTMEVCVDVTVLVLGRTNTFRVSTEVVTAETVIVGAVPETFLAGLPQTQ